MNKLILHIGLPKTGTTSLQQDIFPNLSCNYLGVKQPRELLQNSFYERLMEFIKTGDDDIQKDEIIKELKFLLSQKVVLLSDEMFTVDQKTATWQQKLSRLGKLLHGIEVQILVTLREPIAAVKSYYTELCTHSMLYWNIPLSVFITKCNESKIYQYNLLLSELNMHFKGSHIVLEAFETIIKENNIQQILKPLDLVATSTINLKNRNKKKKTQSDVYATGKNKLAKKLSKISFKRNSIIKRFTSLLIEKNTHSFLVNTNLDPIEEKRVSDLMRDSILIWEKSLGNRF